jgi:hypothetical protein
VGRNGCRGPVIQANKFNVLRKNKFKVNHKNADAQINTDLFIKLN